MEKELFQPNQLYQDLDKLIQENLDLSIKLHVTNANVGKLKLQIERLKAECSALRVSQSLHSR